MGRIVAISSGDLQSTQAINKYTVSLTNKPSPNVLFIGTASEDNVGYIVNMGRVFGNLKCNVKALCLVTKTYTEAEIDELLSWADIIYVGGGDTVFMMRKWKEVSLDKKLKDIYQKDSAVLMGISAGAICWFSCGHSDSEAVREEEFGFGWAEGMLDIHHFAFAPHYDEEGRDSFDVMLKQKNIIGLGVETDAAFVEINGTISYIKCSENAKVYRLEYVDGELQKEELEVRRI